MTHPMTPLRDWKTGWHRDARCQGADTNLFYPEDYHHHIDMDASESQKQRQRANLLHYARRYCAACPVRIACLEEAYELHDEYGIRGGLTAAERARLKRSA